MLQDLWRLNDPLFGDLGRLLSRIDSEWNSGARADLRSAPRGSFPLLNVGETEDTVNVYMFAPGIEQANLDVSVQDNVLMISGKRDDVTDEDNGRSWYRRERFHGEFRRAVTLPEGVDPEQVSASLKDGVLTVSLRKRAETQPRRIEIQAA